jgi:hypothetical protein
MENFKVICVNDKYKPDGFIGDWIKKGEVYDVDECVTLIRQRNINGYKLAGKNIHPESKYQYYLSNRFKPFEEEDLEAEEAVAELLEETLVEYV